MHLSKLDTYTLFMAAVLSIPFPNSFANPPANPPPPLSGVTVQSAVVLNLFVPVILQSAE